MLPPGTSVAGYVIERVLGKGGMGVVYAAHQERLRRRVALKLLAPELADDSTFAERFRREGVAQAAIDHPNLVPLYEAGESEHGLFLAMRLIPGPTLKDRIRAGPLEPDHAVRLLVPIARALDVAHSEGLIHRDIKPGNILIGPDEHPYLSDFGLTKLAGDLSLTATGQFAGTIEYTAPELIRGEPATALSDVYALGAVLHECLTGTVPFPRPTAAAAMFAHVNDPAPRVTDARPELPSAVDHVVAKALAKDPADRYQRATALAEDAERVLAVGELATSRGRHPAAARRAARTLTAKTTPALPARRSHRRLAWVAVPLLVIGSAVTVALLTRGGEEPADAPSRPTPSAQATQAGANAEGPHALTTVLHGTDPFERAVANLRRRNGFLYLGMQWDTVDDPRPGERREVALFQGLDRVRRFGILPGGVVTLGGDVREYAAEVALPAEYRAFNYAGLIDRSEASGRLILYVAIDKLKEP